MKIYINNYKSSIGTGTNNIKGKSRNHYTHNTSGSSLSSNHFYKMSINSKNSSENKKNKNIIKNNMPMPIHGTIKIINKSSYSTRKEGGQNLYEDYNIQYMEPLEGRLNGENGDENDLEYNSYLKGVKNDLNKTKQDYHFVNELGFNDNLLRTKEIFDKIKKQSKLNLSSKQNSLSSFNNIFIRNKIGGGFDDGIIDINDRLYEDYEDNNIDGDKETKGKRRKKRKRKNKIISVAKLFLSKIDMKKYLNNKKRVVTYDNINDINKYLNKDDIILNKEERNTIPRKLNSGKIAPKFLDKLREKNEYIEEQISEDYFNKINSDEDEIDKILGFKRKKNIIIEPYTLLDENYNGEEDEDEIGNRKNNNIKNDLNKQKNSTNNVNKQNNKNNKNNNKQSNKNKPNNLLNKLDGKKEEIKGVGEREREGEGGEKGEENKGDYKHPLIKLEEDIQRRNLNIDKKKKKKKHQNANEEKKKGENKPKKNLFLGRNKNIIKIQFKDTISTKIEDKKHRLKSPAINSILNDISNLSNSIIKRNKKEKKVKDIQYDQNFGYEYWKENKFRESILHPLSSNKKGAHSFRSINSTIAPDDTFSICSSNFSWLLNNNYSYIKEDVLNPYSVNWTKKVLQNSFNRKIKLKKNLSGIPEIELMSRIKFSISSSQPKMNYNRAHIVDNKNNYYYKKNSKVFGRIYNNNDVEFPLISKS